MVDDTQKLVSPPRPEPAGKVVIDNRGRNVWQWQDAQLDSTSIVLKRLENDALELEPTRRAAVIKKGRHAAASGGAEKPRRGGLELEGEISIEQTLSIDAAGGFDPYNRS